MYYKDLSRSLIRYFIVISVLFLLTGINNHVFSQFAITGEVGENDIYTNPEPDSMFQVAAYLANMHSEGSFSIDVDQNGIMDFRISGYGSGGLGGYSGSARIYSLNTGTKIITHEETSEGYPGDVFYTVNVADTLNPGQTINSNSVFNQTVGYLWSTNGGLSSGAYVHTWNSTEEDHYIGFMIKPNTDTLYGWIRLNVVLAGGSCKVTLKDFACNINEFASIERQVSDSFSVYPNPASGYINISSGSNNTKTEVWIYNSIGTKVDMFLIENNLSIDISDYSPGIYYIKFNNNPDVQKVVVY